MADQRPDRAAQAAALAAAMAAYQSRTQSLRDSITAFIERLWAALGSYRNADMDRFVAQVVPVVAGAQQQMVALTSANLAQQQQIALGGRFTPVAVDPRTVTGAGARNGADPVDVYGRPFHLVWRQLHDLPREPGSIDQAIQAGLDRAVLTALTDVQLTKVQTAQLITQASKHVTGYRRVLEGPYSCGLCIVASTARYHKKDLLPLHPNCDCAVQLIFGDDDPGHLIDVDTLAGVHERIQEAFGRSSPAAGVIPGARDGRGKAVQYRDVLITHQHGELGAVLAVKGRPFTGPDDLTF